MGEGTQRGSSASSGRPKANNWGVCLSLSWLCVGYVVGVCVTVLYFSSNLQRLEEEALRTNGLAASWLHGMRHARQQGLPRHTLPENGMAIYGKDFGRYPFDPQIVIKR